MKTIGNAHLGKENIINYGSISNVPCLLSEILEVKGVESVSQIHDSYNIVMKEGFDLKELIRVVNKQNCTIDFSDERC